MTTRLLLMLMFLRCMHLSWSQTSVPAGNVSGVWTQAGSPYTIMGDIDIINGQTLIIQTGTTINFQGHYKFYVHGRLLAIGTPANKITFTAADTINGWWGVRVDAPVNANDSTILTYCNLKWGNASGNGSNDDLSGGALYINNFSKVRVDHCLLSKSKAQFAGAALHCVDCTPTIKSNTISLNSQSVAAVSLANSSLLFANNVVMDNLGGGILCTGTSTPSIAFNRINNNTFYGIAGVSSLAIRNNTISGNYGVGIDVGGMSPTSYTISNNIITHNSGTNGGGIFSISYGSMFIDYNLISNNRAAVFAGGLALLASAVNGTTSVTNNVIVNNENTTPSMNGGGVSILSYSPSFINNTVANNHCQGFGGGIELVGTPTSKVQNCVIYGNTAVSGGSQVHIRFGTNPNFTYNNIQGGLNAISIASNSFSGVYQNNIDQPPLFYQPSGGSGWLFAGDTTKWWLQSGSPCVDTGNPSGPYPASDFAGNLRLWGNCIDMGAYELQPPVGIAPHSRQNVILSVYPNPGQNQVTVEADIPGRLAVYSQLGELLMEQPVITGKNKIDISQLSNSIYLLKYSGNNYREWTIKLIKTE
jgi:hypothetical protein